MRIIEELMEIWPNEVCNIFPILMFFFTTLVTLNSPLLFFHLLSVRLANSKAGIKPTAPLSVFDKENSIEFLLDSLHYLYNYYMVCALLSHAYHVTYHVTSM